jgi:hypothetical protein
MIWRILPWLAMLAWAAATTGCENAKPAFTPNGAVAVPLDAAKQRGSVTVRLANLVTFAMPPTAPGLVWQISFHDTRYLKQHTDFTPPQTPGAGATVSFVAVSMGTTRLRFVLVPVSLDRSVESVAQQNIVVEIR